MPADALRKRRKAWLSWLLRVRRSGDLVREYYVAGQLRMKAGEAGSVALVVAGRGGTRQRESAVRLVKFLMPRADVAAPGTLDDFKKVVGIA